MEKKKFYSIGEIADKTGVSIRTLHYYDDIGLLTPAKDESSGHRKYREDDIIKLQKIISYKFIGFSLEQIKEILSEQKFNMNLVDSFMMQKKLFEKEKKRIETSISAIDRAIKIIHEHGEIDSVVLMSLIRSMQTEDKQREWLESYFDKDVVDMIYVQTEGKMQKLDNVFIDFTKRVKELVGSPVDSPEVINLIEEYMKSTLSLFDDNFMETLATQTGNLDEINYDELEKLAPTPFSKEEEEWLNKAMEHYIKQSKFGEN
ncbi:MerR family transcriptional regulator [Caldifermentibacillus hisashii]|uniref:MerR family transcriptional regulator n=2 Tax=Bacillaceae TaxID=186817 RepID=UPI003134D1C4